MRVEPLDIDGAWVFTPRTHRDHGGSFLELFREGGFSADGDCHFEVAQVSLSVSRRGAIRGLHYSDVPPGQARYVTCVSGEVLDVVVDVRAGSPRFGTWQVVRLDDAGRRAVFLSEGLAHGFMALSESATMLYVCSTPYTPGRERVVYPLDPAIGIPWPLVHGEPVLSESDAAAPTLGRALKSGLLPRYSDCVAYSTRPGATHA